jgi:hypothetical protein
MKVLDDLDAMTWSTTFAAFMLCTLVAFIEVRNRKKRGSARNGFRLVLILIGAFWCGILGFSTLDNASDAERAFAVGKLQVTGYAYAGRGSHIARYLVCVTECNSTSVPLVMEPRAQSIVKDHKSSPALKVGYLHESDMIGGDTDGYKVVDISDPSTGVSFYHVDTSHHSVRAGLYFADAALFLLAGLLGLRRAKDEPTGALHSFVEHPAQEPSGI